MRLGIDSGGTFTDAVFIRGGELHAAKTFSTPKNPAEAVIELLRQIGPGPEAEIRHGMTVGANTVLERNGARVAFITTEGFEDSVEIGRQARGKLYDWFWSPPEPLVAAGMRFGLKERTRPDGSILIAPEESALAGLIRRVRRKSPEAIAVSLLFSFANLQNERAVGASLRALDVPVSLSHQILPEFREFERASTVIVNAYIAPKMGRYLAELEAVSGHEFPRSRLRIMQSSGGVISAATAAREPVRTILSGPVGGVVGAREAARQSGFTRIITLDMGGTSTDVSLLADERGSHWQTTRESMIGGFPVCVPMLSIHTVGAGGGSIARFDTGGALQVGPQSAGADPGPACFGRGDQPTVTDANLLLGRMDPDLFLGGSVHASAARARECLTRHKGCFHSVEGYAEAILAVAEGAVADAVRLISVERGYDPREFTLVAFGGAGPLQACAVARALRIPRVLIPRFPGALSALGILISNVIRDYSRTVMLPPDSPKLERRFQELERFGEEEFRREGLSGQIFRSLDMRYRGQGYELNIEWGRDFLARFHRAHQKRYGNAGSDRPVEVVNARVRIEAVSERVPLPKLRPAKGDCGRALIRETRARFGGRFVRTKVYERSLLARGDVLEGPAIVGEYSATTVLPPGARARLDRHGNITIRAGG